jgi:hypothetical protein
MEKLYNLYCVVSNKKVRRNEKKYKRYPSVNGVPGVMVKTNRGYFIDGRQVDIKAVKTYLALCKAARDEQNRQC